jgi:HD superfamily phosphohydrolase
MEVRDPIHGAIPVADAEIPVVDHPFVQRLRGVRSTGFSHLPFPGATHSRYSHSLGVMHLAGKAFDSAYADFGLDAATTRRFRHVVRLAALCHDLGHAPFSHSTEFAMPPVSELRISWYRHSEERRASHEDYTIALLQHTSLASTIAANGEATAQHVAALISQDVASPDDFFVHQGLDHRPILSQFVSSELDVDRLDYLLRDSYYTGARYGQIDVAWLVSNLVAHAMGDEVSLALDFPALYAFDDFLIARHHMFLMVYFHHKSVAYEELLKRWVLSADTEWSLSADLDAYLYVDDISLEAYLRTSKNEYARRMVERRPFRRVLEVHGTPSEVDLSGQAQQLRDAGIDVIHAGSTGKLSRYNVFGQKRERAPDLYVLERMQKMPVERVQSLTDASKVFLRYADARRIARLYVRPEEVGRARGVLDLPV